MQQEGLAFHLLQREAEAGRQPLQCGQAVEADVGAVIAVPVVAVLYSSIRFWVNTGSRAGFTPPPSDPTGTGAALP